MPLLILLAFILVPLAEIAVFIQVGDAIGLWPTLGTIVATAVLGTVVLRAQGVAVLARARQSMDQGIAPVREVIHGACLLFAGALLLTPGFITDAIGFLLFVPAMRDAVARFIGRRVRAVHARQAGRPGTGGQGTAGESPAGGPVVIDVDYEELGPGRTDSPWRGDADKDQKP